MKTAFISNRRTFLKGAAAFAGFTAWLGLGRRASAVPKPAAPVKDESAGGYRLTEHVKKYYETAGF